MHQAPEKPGGKGELEQQTRWERLTADSQPVPLPPLSARYLLDWLSDLGFVSAGGMGPAPLSALEMQAWCQMTNTALQPWEFDALRAASRAYCAQSVAKDPFAPWADRESSARPTVAGRFKAIAQQLNNTRNA